MFRHVSIAVLCTLLSCALASDIPFQNIPSNTTISISAAGGDTRFFSWTSVLGTNSALEIHVWGRGDPDLALVDVNGDVIAFAPLSTTPDELLIVSMVGSGETVYFSVTAFGIASDYNVIVLPYAYPVAHSSSPDYSRMMELASKLNSSCDSRITNNFSDDYCSWSGVFCDANARVRIIDWSNMCWAAGASLPDPLCSGGAFQELHTLVLFDAQELSGEFPRVFACNSLTNIALTNSKVNGSFNPRLCFLPRLELGCIFLEELPNVSEPYPTCLRQKDYVGRLIVSNVPFTGNLWWLCDLATNGIHFTGPGIFGTPYYRQTVPVCQPGSAIFADPKVELVFMGMGLNGNDPRWACDLPGVAILALGYNELDGNLSPCLAQILQLIFLFVAGNPTLGGELPELASSVQEADFSNTSIRGTVPASYGGRPSLVALSLENLDLHGPLPDLSSVKVLSLRGNCFDIPVGGYPGWAIDAGVEFLAPNCVPSQATTSTATIGAKVTGVTGFNPTSDSAASLVIGLQALLLVVALALLIT